MSGRRWGVLRWMVGPGLAARLAIGWVVVATMALGWETGCPTLAQAQAQEDPPRPAKARTRAGSAAQAQAQGKAKAKADAEPTAALAREARAVLKQHCFRCHHGQGSEGGEFDVLQTEHLLSPEYWEPALVVPGKPNASYLMERVTKNQMPPRNIRQRLTPAEQETLRNWIAAGAPAATEQSQRRPFVRLASVLQAARDHLRDADPDTRGSLRFFTLHTLSNNPRVLDDDLRLARAALSKALNSLSRQPDLVLPQAVDPARTVYVVDLRALGWDRRNLWNALERAYPYGLEYDGKDPALARLDRDLRDQTACDLPILRADWFIAAATRPPLYHTLLQLPTTAAELERELGVDIAKAFADPRPERIARAAFAKSGVSGQNRLVERNQPSRGGYYWPSYDFLASNGRSKLTRFPLGPLNLYPEGQHPFPNQAFRHDGGEIIFSLENGLQAYLLVDSEGRRISAGPIAVVNDPLKTSGTPEIVTGLSCMACHKHGMIEFTDVLRGSNAVFGAAEQQVKRLYPEKAVMDRLVRQDAERFLTALEKVIGPYLRDGVDQSRPIREFPEPIAEVARFYRLEFLDLPTVACELDVEDPQEILRQVGETKLKRLGLEDLFTGGVVNRQEWDAADGLSLMQELARELRFSPLVVR